MNTHCGLHESLVFHGRILGAEESVSVCLQPGLQYGFHYGVPGRPLITSFSIDGMKVRGDYDWERIGDADWTFLALPFEGVTYTIWVSRPESGDDLPQGRIEIAGRGANTTFAFEPSSIFSTLPFD